MEPKPKILMILNDMAWFWSHRLPLAKGILKNGYKLTVAAEYAKDDSKMRDMGIDTRNLCGYDKGFNPLAELLLLLSIHKAIKITKPDIIHAITLRHALYTGIAARLLRHPKSVFTIAGLGSLFAADSAKAKILRLIAMPVFKFAFGHKGAKLIFQNPDDYQIMIDRGVVNASQCVIIKGSGVDLNQFPYTPPPHNDVPVMLFSSRLIAEKGLDDYVEASRLLKEKGIKARFLVAGDTTHKNPKNMDPKQVQTWHDAELIEWLGNVDDMPKRLQSCDIFILPSYYREGVPKVILEALATGRPIITTDKPGCKETVDEGINGYKIPAKNGAAIAEKIETLLADQNLMEKMSQASRQKAETEFSVDSVVERTLKIYE